MKAKPEQIKKPKREKVRCVNYFYCRNMTDPNFSECSDCKKFKYQTEIRTTRSIIVYVDPELNIKLNNE